ncbi:hypothetical protein Aduo_012895 [Ancylostoma duodenale]
MQTDSNIFEIIVQHDFHVLRHSCDPTIRSKAGSIISVFAPPSSSGASCYECTCTYRIPALGSIDCEIGYNVATFVTRVKDLRDLHQQQASFIEEKWKQMKDSQKNIDNRVEALLKLKTLFALIKAELINSMRKEYDSFRNYQQFLMDSSPKPATREERQPIVNNQKHVHDIIARIEQKLSQNSRVLAHTINTVELLTKEIQALRELHTEKT